jgi:hypothetical protein
LLEKKLNILFSIHYPENVVDGLVGFNPWATAQSAIS